MEPSGDCRGITILLVDDDLGFRRGLAAVLADDGHRVLDYGSPADVPANGDLAAVQLLISDYYMPGEDGLSFIDRFHRERPDVPVILVTAHQIATVSSADATRPFLRILWKPFQYDVAHALIHEVAGGALPES